MRLACVASEIPAPTTALEWWAIGSTLVALVFVVVTLIRWVAPRWVAEVARGHAPPSTPTLNGSSSVHRDLGAHDAQLSALAEGQTRTEAKIDQALTILTEHQGVLGAIVSKLWPDAPPAAVARHNNGRPPATKDGR